jgi:hypothetical protein
LYINVFRVARNLSQDSEEKLCRSDIYLDVVRKPGTLHIPALNRSSLTFTSFSRSGILAFKMGCCGESADSTAQGQSNNRQIPSSNGFVTQQPAAYPAAQYAPKLQTSIPAPAPTVAHPNTGAYGQTGYQPAQTQPYWGQTSPPPMSQSSANMSTPPLTSPSPPTTSTSPHPTLMRPTPIHPAGQPHVSLSAPQMMSYGQKKPSDEGKMSVSIDFGA